MAALFVIQRSKVDRIDGTGGIGIGWSILLVGLDVGSKRDLAVLVVVQIPAGHDNMWAEIFGYSALAGNRFNCLVDTIAKYFSIILGFTL